MAFSHSENKKSQRPLPPGPKAPSQLLRTIRFPREFFLMRIGRSSACSAPYHAIEAASKPEGHHETHRACRAVSRVGFCAGVCDSGDDPGQDQTTRHVPGVAE